MPCHKRNKIPCSCGCGEWLSQRQERRHRQLQTRSLPDENTPRPLQAESLPDENVPPPAVNPESPHLPRSQVARNIRSKQKGRNRVRIELYNNSSQTTALEARTTGCEPLGNAINTPAEPMDIDSSLPYCPPTPGNARSRSVTVEEVPDEDEDGYGYQDYGDFDEGDFVIDDTVSDSDAHLWEKDYTGSHLWEAGFHEDLEKELYSAGTQ